MDKELQKDEFYLKGDLGTVTIGCSKRAIKKVVQDNQSKSVTLTVSPINPKEYFNLLTEPPNPNDLGNGVKLDAKNFWIDVEDIDHEVINPKLLTESKK